MTMTMKVTVTMIDEWVNDTANCDVNDNESHMHGLLTEHSTRRLLFGLEIIEYFYISPRHNSRQDVIIKKYGTVRKYTYMMQIPVDQHMRGRL